MAFSRSAHRRGWTSCWRRCCDGFSRGDAPAHPPPPRNPPSCSDVLPGGEGPWHAAAYRCALQRQLPIRESLTSRAVSLDPRDACRHNYGSWSHVINLTHNQYRDKRMSLTEWPKLEKNLTLATLTSRTHHVTATEIRTQDIINLMSCVSLSSPALLGQTPLIRFLETIPKRLNLLHPLPFGHLCGIAKLKELGR